MEYDFVHPTDIPQGALLHIQFAGADSNNNGNAGNGKAGTDCSNLVQISGSGITKASSIHKHTLFFNGEEQDSYDEEYEPEDVQNCDNWWGSCHRNRPNGEELVAKLAFLDQDYYARSRTKACPSDPEDYNNQDNKNQNCYQLNNAPAYYDGGLVEMRDQGTHHIASTRNNDYSNRSHKSKIIVTGRAYGKIELALAIIAPILASILAYQIGLSTYAMTHPNSSVFGRRNRPCLLWCICCRPCVRRQEAVRLQYKKALQDKWMEQQKEKKPAGAKGGANAENLTSTAPPEGFDAANQGRCSRCIQWCTNWTTGLFEVHNFFCDPLPTWQHYSGNHRLHAQ
jgi:hypothetical protein